MNLFLALFFLTFSLLQSNFLESHAPINKPRNTEYFINRVSESDKRYPSMKMALDLMEARKSKTLVETGTFRSFDLGLLGFYGDGGSTLIFGEWAYDNEALLHSVDINPISIKTSKSSLGSNTNVKFVCSDSVKFLSEFENQIDFLYLDSFDFELSNPFPSQRHHLKEIEAAYPNLTPSSIVMIDDCDLPYGGKGTLVIAYLLERGWTIAYKGYQTILLYQN
jgi:hypothetical protein